MSRGVGTQRDGGSLGMVACGAATASGFWGCHPCLGDLLVAGGLGGSIESWSAGRRGRGLGAACPPIGWGRGERPPKSCRKGERQPPACGGDGGSPRPLTRHLGQPDPPFAQCPCPGGGTTAPVTQVEPVSARPRAKTLLGGWRGAGRTPGWVHPQTRRCLRDRQPRGSRCCAASGEHDRALGGWGWGGRPPRSR